jgi:hypothetical protein
MAGGLPIRIVKRSRAPIDLSIEASRRNGGDPLIGRRLHRLLESAGFVGVEASLVQPFGRSGAPSRRCG